MVKMSENNNKTSEMSYIHKTLSSYVLNNNLKPKDISFWEAGAKVYLAFWINLL